MRTQHRPILSSPCLSSVLILLTFLFHSASLAGWKLSCLLFSAVLIWWSLPARQWRALLTWRFAEVCMPLELAISLANDSGAGSQGSAGRLARLPRWIFWEAVGSLWGTSLPAHSPSLFSVSSPSLFCCCMSVHAYILGGAFFFLRHIFDFWGNDERGEKRKKCVCKINPFLLTYSLYMKSRAFSSSPLA